ncbi:MAG: hypothetical protein KKI06_13090, partial [Euryarchaeota archaeon]|nr:hypothetical protein [Euryarchaeota archaeon]
LATNLRSSHRNPAGSRLRTHVCPEGLLDIRTNHATKQYGAKTYYPANIMNILNEKRNKR